VVGARIDDQAQRRALAAAPFHHRLALARWRPVVERADQDQGRDRHCTALRPASGIIGDGRPEVAIEQRLDSSQCDRRWRHHRALGVADDRDALGIYERLGRQIEQSAIGIRHPVDIRVCRR
jgi:hypothetical protein